MSRLLLNYKSDVYIVPKHSAQVRFLSDQHPLYHVRHRLDVVQASMRHPEWCVHDMWYDLYLPLHIVKYLHNSYRGEVRWAFDNGDIIDGIESYEEAIPQGLDHEAEYGDLLDRISLVSVEIGRDVKVYTNPTYSRFPYCDAFTHSIYVADYKEYDYMVTANELAGFLADYFKITLL